VIRQIFYKPWAIVTQLNHARNRALILAVGATHPELSEEALLASCSCQSLQNGVKDSPKRRPVWDELEYGSARSRNPIA
jgi:hypothetical protein